MIASTCVGSFPVAWLSTTSIYLDLSPRTEIFGPSDEVGEPVDGSDDC